MCCLLVIALLGWSACVAFHVPYYSMDQAKQHFVTFMAEYDKIYSSDKETIERFQIFKENLEHANQLNNNSKSAVFGITKFMDSTEDEFRHRVTCLTSRGNPSVSAYQLGDVVTKSQAPDEFDWRKHNAVTAVKDQGYCGSCWAFSAIGSIEGAYAIKYKTLQRFSEQQLVDCVQISFTRGCDGGLMTDGFQEIVNQGGLESEENYPYVAKRGTCKFDRGRAKVKLSGFNTYPFHPYEFDKLKDVVQKTEPISVGIQADVLLNYMSGIIDAKACNTGPINHGVVLVGYGSENGKPYWSLKNSWGANWGEAGFFRIERSDANACSMLNGDMSSAILT